jgi:hypothetical protein
LLLRLLQEDENLTIEEAGLAASALAALGGRGHAEALATLSAINVQTKKRRLVVPASEQTTPTTSIC